MSSDPFPSHLIKLSHPRLESEANGSYSLIWTEVSVLNSHSSKNLAYGEIGFSESGSSSTANYPKSSKVSIRFFEHSTKAVVISTITMKSVIDEKISIHKSFSYDQYLTEVVWDNSVSSNSMVISYLINLFTSNSNWEYRSAFK